MLFIQVFQKIFDHLFQSYILKKSIQNCSLFPKPERNSGKKTLKKLNKSKKTPLPPTLLHESINTQLHIFLEFLVEFGP